MSDNENPSVPAWLAGGELQPAAPISSEDVAEHIAAEIPGELLGMPSIEAGPEPIAINTEIATEIAAVADMLIKGKRFWQAPANTENEQTFALQLAEYLFMRYGN